MSLEKRIDDFLQKRGLLGAHDPFHRKINRFLDLIDSKDLGGFLSNQDFLSLIKDDQVMTSLFLGGYRGLEDFLEESRRKIEKTDQWIEELFYKKIKDPKSDREWFLSLMGKNNFHCFVDPFGKAIQRLRSEGLLAKSLQRDSKCGKAFKGEIATDIVINALQSGDFATFAKSAKIDNGEDIWTLHVFSRNIEIFPISRSFLQKMLEEKHFKCLTNIQMVIAQNGNLKDSILSNQGVFAINRDGEQIDLSAQEVLIADRLVQGWTKRAPNGKKINFVLNGIFPKLNLVSTIADISGINLEVKEEEMFGKLDGLMEKLENAKGFERDPSYTSVLEDFISWIEKEKLSLLGEKNTPGKVKIKI